MSSDGVLRSLDISASQPKLLWEFFAGMPSFSSAAIGPDPTAQDPYLIYVGSGDGLVYALTPNGLRRWSYDIAAFYAEQSSNEGADPAFWPAFRYPAINSSLVLGNRGAVTATSGGFVLSIPYDAYQHTDSAFFKTNPDDNYWAQLPQSGIRLCYVSPAGRMANQLLPEEIQVYAGQTISLAGLCRHLDGPTPRSSFTTLPTDVQVRVNGAAQNDWKLSADRTQVHLASPLPQSNEDGFELEISQPGGQILGRTRCIYRTVQDPASLDDVLKSQYSVQQMSFCTPFIVPALDQLGLATITIPFKFLSIDENTGAAVAYGYESYASGASDAPRRNLIYAFTGSYVAGNFLLLSGSCYCELTGFPVLLDQLSISGMLHYSEAAGSQRLAYTGVSLTASYRSTLLKQIEWLLTYLSHWVDLGQLVPNWSDLWKNFSLYGLFKALENLVNNILGPPTAYGRFATFLFRVVSAEYFGGSSIFAPWTLFDKEGGFFWVGTYELSPSAPKPSSYTASFSYDSWSGNLEVKVNDCEPDDVVGIVVLDQNSQPLPLNYTDLNSLPTYQHETKTITQSLSLLGTSLDPDAEAMVMVNLEQAEPKYKFSSGMFGIQNKK
jgi:hypothetical protein